MATIVAGLWIRAVGARDLAGSGTVLDPKLARRDLEPYSRMAGGMVKDALEEADVAASPERVVKIRCRACEALSDETSKFCGQCGAKL
jgi:hypothetical protein